LDQTISDVIVFHPAQSRSAIEPP